MACLCCCGLDKIAQIDAEYSRKNHKRIDAAKIERVVELNCNLPEEVWDNITVMQKGLDFRIH